MRRYVIDTNVYGALMAGSREVARSLQLAQELILCPFVLGELLAGFKAGTRTEANRRELEEFLDTRRVKTVVADDDTAELYAEIHLALRRKGNPIPPNDMWIAATAMQHGAAVCTLDAHFDYVDGLMVVRPGA